MDSFDKDIPAHMQEALVRAIQDICILIHGKKRCAGVKMEIVHTSDAVHQTGMSQVRISIAGEGTFNLAEPHGAKLEDPKKIAEHMLNEILKKNKGEE